MPAADAASNLVQLEQVSGIYRLVLSRSNKRNAINKDMYDQAVQQIAVLEHQGVPVAVLSSVGPVFCAGADLGELSSGFNAPVALAERLLRSGIFWIAEVQGGVLGAGVALVSGCHAAIGNTDAWFCLPELRHGFYPESIIAWTVGRGISKRWLHGLAVTCRRATAAEAAANGLLSDIVPNDQPLDQEVNRIADRIRSARASLDSLLDSWRGGERAAAW